MYHNQNQVSTIIVGLKRYSIVPMVYISRAQQAGSLLETYHVFLPGLSRQVIGTF